MYDALHHGTAIEEDANTTRLMRRGCHEDARRSRPLSDQLSTNSTASIARQLLQLTTKSRGALVICNISDRRPRGNYAKPRIEGSEFAQKRLEGRLTYASFLWSRRILERLQAIQNQ